ncbi:MAG: hypothetical protein OXG04_00470, partial [Acidobacteria bacterium]|nr:hypothetical protein [Acidobacteriota bacterium]
MRAVRHHDDHTPLGGGSRQDYLPIQQATDMDEDIAGRPRNRQQASFETDRSPVRVLRGRPGSGKTTALWRAIEARSGEHVLYVTWSARLKRSAEERLGGLAPPARPGRAAGFPTPAPASNTPELGPDRSRTAGCRARARGIGAPPQPFLGAALQPRRPGDVEDVLARPRFDGPPQRRRLAASWASAQHP